MRRLNNICVVMCVPASPADNIQLHQPNHVFVHFVLANSSSCVYETPVFVTSPMLYWYLTLTHVQSDPIENGTKAKENRYANVICCDENLANLRKGLFLNDKTMNPKGIFDQRQ